MIAGYNWLDLLLRVLAVIVILIVTAILAGLVKKGLRALLGKVKVLNRHPDSGRTLADSLATIGSMLIWLVGLMAVLNLFNLTGVLAPINGLLTGFLDALPRIIGAALVLFIGLTLAKVVRELVTTALEAAGADRWAEKISGNVDRRLANDGVRDRQNSPYQQQQSNATPQGQPYGDPRYAQPQQPQQPPRDPSQQGSGRPQQTAGSTRGKFSISNLVGQIVYALIAIVVAIAALGILDIRAISDPATQMLNMILEAIPVIVAAGILLAIGVVVARFVGGILQSVLEGLNIDGALAKVGIDTKSTDVASIITRIVQIAIVLFFAVAATGVLGFPALTNMLNTILEIAGRVVFGAVVIAAGVFIAHIVSGFLSGRTATIVKYAAIVLFSAIGLNFMGLADSIVNLAFGALVVGAAAAAALAFGLGGREAAARQLEKMQRSVSTPSQPKADPAQATASGYPEQTSSDTTGYVPPAPGSYPTQQDWNDPSQH